MFRKYGPINQELIDRLASKEAEVCELLDRIEEYEERLGHTEAEAAALRDECDVLRNSVERLLKIVRGR